MNLLKSLFEIFLCMFNLGLSKQLFYRQHNLNLKTVMAVITGCRINQFQRLNCYFLFSLDVKDELDSASISLKEQYKNELENFSFMKLKTGDGEWFRRVKRNDFHVSLAVIPSAEVDRDWLHSDREYHLANFDKDRQTLNYDDLLTVNDKFLILRGIAGIGKTSLMDYLLLQWANGRIWNSSEKQLSFKFVFKFACRELNLCQKDISIEELFERFYPNIFRQIKFEDLVESGEDILIIVDGLDEFCEQKEILQSQPALLSELMSIGGVLHNLLGPLRVLSRNQRTIIASRHESANAMYRNWGKVIEIKRVDVIGFNRQTMSAYVSNFADAIGKPDLHKEVLHKITESETLKVMSQIPVYLWIICSIFEDDINVPTPQTYTELYIWAFGMFVREHFREFDNSVSSLASSSLPEIFSDKRCRRILKVTSCLAYGMLEEGKVLFHEKDIKSLGISVDRVPTEASGFIAHTKRSYIEGDVYQFKHLVLQEFFAACHLVGQDEPILQNALVNNKFFNVVPLVAGLQGGLTENSNSSELVKCFARSLRIKVIFPVIDFILIEKTFYPGFYGLISAVFEFASQLSEQSRTKIAVQLELKKTEFGIDYYYQLSHFTHFMRQMLFKGNIATKCEDTKRTVRSIPKLDKVSVCIQLNQHQLSSLADVVYFTECLMMFTDTDDGTEGFRVLAEKIVNFHDDTETKGQSIRHKRNKVVLKKIRFHNRNLNEQQVRAIAKAVPRIEEVGFSWTKSFGTAGFKALAESIMRAQNLSESRGTCIALRKLNLSFCNLDDSELIAFAKAIPCVQRVDVTLDFLISTVAVKILTMEIVTKGNSIALKELGFHGCYWSEDNLSALAKAIPYIQSVKFWSGTLDGEAGLKTLSEEILNAQNQAESEGKGIALKNLTFCKCPLDEMQLIALSEAVPYVEKIHFCGSILEGGTGLKLLTERIISVQSLAENQGKTITLKELWLIGCEFSENQLKMIAKLIPCVQVRHEAFDKSVRPNNLEMLSEETRNA